MPLIERIRACGVNQLIERIRACGVNHWLLEKNFIVSFEFANQEQGLIPVQ